MKLKELKQQLSSYPPEMDDIPVFLVTDQGENPGWKPSARLWM
jgi:hypothetical protein